MPVGFIGTGNIGNPMARRMIGAGHPLVVHDLREEAASNLIELGATWAASPREVAEQCDVLLTSLPGPPEVERVMLGPAGILEGARPGTVLFDLSSNSPAMVHTLAARAAERGVTLLDAPVSGGAQGAAAGTLAVMVGGDRAAFDAHKHLLEAFGANVFHVGDLGNGATVKLMNNMVNFVCGLVLDEALVVAVKAGIPAETLHQVLSVSSASDFVSRMPALIERRFEQTRPTFTLALGTKDTALAVRAGNELGVPMPVASAAEQLFVAAKAMGLGEEAPAAALRVYERAAGVEVRGSTPAGA